MVDQFTKWVELAALPAQNAELIAKAFLKHFVVTFGCLLEVHTDQGKKITSDLFLAFCKLMGITKTRTSPYHPAGNDFKILHRKGAEHQNADSLSRIRDPLSIEPSCKWSVLTSPEVRKIGTSTFPLSLWHFIR